MGSLLIFSAFRSEFVETAESNHVLLLNSIEKLLSVVDWKPLVVKILQLSLIVDSQGTTVQICRAKLATTYDLAY